MIITTRGGKFLVTNLVKLGEEGVGRSCELEG